MVNQSPVATDIRAALVDALCRAGNPRTIVLFGSQARGESNERSDLDLLVVEEAEDWRAPTRRQEIGRLRRALPRIGCPIDLLLFTTAEMIRWRGAQNHVVAEAMERGVVLYERS
jgi:predicted nucleotidyltransferase